MINNGKFKNLRKEAKLSREHLSAKLGISASLVQVIETMQKHQPSINIILKYMKYFNVELEDLVYMEDVTLGDIG